MRPEPVWKGAEISTPARIPSPDISARSESLYRLSYRGPQPYFYFSSFKSHGTFTFTFTHPFLQGDDWIECESCRKWLQLFCSPCKDKRFDCSRKLLLEKHQ